MENQIHTHHEDATPDIAVTIPRVTPEIVTPDTGISAPQANHFEGLRKYLAGALAAAAIISESNPAHGDEPKKDPQVQQDKIVKVARIGGNPSETGDSIVKPVPQKNEKPHESHLKHHTIKVGAIGSIDEHPSFGTEVSWSYMPNLDENSKLHLTITPIDFFAAQHHLEYEGKGEVPGGIKTEPKYFVGSMAGFVYNITPHVELEFEIGGGMAAIPYYKRFENNAFQNFSYQLAPVLKADLQMDFVVNPHFRTYLAYSPEYVPMPIPHAIKDDKIETAPHLSHVVAVGIGTEF